MLKRLLHKPAGQAVVAALLGRYLDGALATTRWSLLGSDNVAPFMTPGQAAVVAFWHECLPLMPALWTIARRQPLGRELRARALVSRHHDGRLIGLLMQRVGIDVAHGSTSRGGAAGMRALLDGLAVGAHAFITPDGPRGPARVAARGVASLAALSGAPILPCAARTSRGRTLRSWDRMTLPLPWGRGRLVCLPPIFVPRHAEEAALPGIEAALTRAAEIAAGHRSM